MHVFYYNLIYAVNNEIFVCLFFVTNAFSQLFNILFGLLQMSRLQNQPTTFSMFLITTVRPCMQ